MKQKVTNLSGGNQQKVVIAKWFASKARIIVLDEPTRGIDIGAKVEVYKLINEMVEAGIGVILLSSEVPEVFGMADRILVLKDGQITGEYGMDEINKINETDLQRLVM
ncbi:MAG: ATP-binding cassette domain-containing protein [Blautia wexlerae]